MIFVSTGQIKNKTIFSIVKYYLQGGIKNIEMSGGKYDPDIINRLISLKKIIILCFIIIFHLKKSIYS